MTAYAGVHRVLIAEDELLIRELLHEQLDREGYEIVGEAVNGVEAVTQTLALHPDVVLMDIKMPEMDGIEATRQIWRTHPTPVVVLSAFNVPHLVDEAIEAGASAYLLKPPSRDDIQHAIKAAVARFKEYIALKNQNQELKNAVNGLSNLKGMLNICASCKRVHAESDEWIPLELYIEKYSNVSFSHGLCPDCAETLYPQFFGNPKKTD